MKNRTVINLLAVMICLVMVQGTGNITVLAATIDYTNGENNTGTITLSEDGTLNVSTGSATQSGDIGETGGSWGITKTGDGTLTLSGTNTYSGGTTINGGTIKIQEIANLGAAGSGIELNNGTLYFYGNPSTVTFTDNITLNAGGGTFYASVNQNNARKFTGIISGSGSLTIEGNTPIVLRNSGNNYTGATVINGLLLPEASEVLPDSTAVTLNGTWNLYSNSETIGSLAGSGAVTFWNALTVGGNGDSTTFSGVLRSSGNLTKTGSGTMTLSGSNTYSGGTTVTDGTLAISADGQLGTGGLTLDGGLLGIAGTGLVNDSDISSNTISFTSNGGGFDIIDPAHTFTYTADLTHAGSLTKSGAGTLVLSGANTYTGGTTVSAGTLSGTTSSLQGAITNNAAVIFDQTVNGTYADIISGTGTVTKAGTGTVTLSGNNTYTGTTTLSAGTLNLTGQVFGDVAVNGGTFMGTGTIANSGNLTLNNGGSFAPGASIGTTYITGNYVQNSGSTLEVEVFKAADNSLSSDLLGVTGSATLASGSTINVTDLTPTDRFILTGDAFTIITADGGITDNGTTVTNTSAVLSFAGSVSGNDYILTAARSSFSGNVTDGNNSSVLGAVDSDMESSSSVSDHEFINALSSLNTAQLNNAAEQLSPSTHANSSSFSMDMSRQLSSDLSVYLGTRRLDMPHMEIPGVLASNNDLLLADASDNPALLGHVIREIEKRNQQAERAQETGYFIKPFGTFYIQDTTDNVAGFSAKSVGTHFGYDKSINDHLILGIGGAYAHAFIDYDYGLGDAEVDSFRIGPYGTYFRNDWFVECSAALSYHMNATDRKIKFGGIDRTSKTSYNSHEASVYLNTGFDIHKGEWTLTPATSMHYTYYRSKAFQERNADSAGLNVDASTQQSLLGKLGIRLHRILTLVDVKIIPEIFVGYAHQFIDEERIHARFMNGVTKFSTDIDSDRDNSAYYGAGLSSLLSENISAFIRYEGERYSGGRSNRFDLGLTIRF